jgi:uncharacterized RDD family membrane protein YckC
MSRHPHAAKPGAPALLPSLIGRPAGFVSRLLALAVDIGLLALVILTGNLLLTALRIAGPVPWIGGRIVAVYPWLEQWFDTAGALFALSLAMGTVVGYFLFFVALDGQTLGKRLLGLKVVSARGGTPTLAQAVVRMLASLLSILPLYLGFLAMLADTRGRTWHDRIAGTLVVYAWQARPDERFLKR